MGRGAGEPPSGGGIKTRWVKIDLAITQKVGQDPAIDRLISLLVNWLADSRCRVVAEGIESHDQVIQLRRLGVRFGQGFGLAYPAHEFPTTVRVPAPGLRMGQIAALPIALVEAYDLCDQHLEIIDQNRTPSHP